MRRSMLRPLGGRTPVAPIAGAILAVLVATALPAAPAAADWLVVRGQGGAAATRVETRGAWEVKGRLVVFHTADGNLASMRLDDVDLEASREATRKAEAAAEEPAPPAAAAAPAKPPRRKITDSDIAPGSGLPPAAEEPAAADGTDAAPAAGPRADSLEVVDSQEEDTADGHTRITGMLTNQGDEPVAGVGLTVELYDQQGARLASVQAEVTERALVAGASTSFVADYPDVFTYGAVRFVPRGTPLAVGPPDSAQGEEAAEGSSP